MSSFATILDAVVLSCSSCLSWPFFCDITDKLKSRCHIVLPSQESPSSRRHVLVGSGASLVAILTFNGGFLPLPVWAEDESNGQEDDEKGVVGAIKSLFDPNEKIKSGKVLPKAYLNSAREVVKTLRESLKEDPKDIAKFRRTADAAKESIREYLSSWRGKQTVVSEVCILQKRFWFLRWIPVVTVLHVSLFFIRKDNCSGIIGILQCCSSGSSIIVACSKKIKPIWTYF